MAMFSVMKINNQEKSTSPSKSLVTGHSSVFVNKKSTVPYKEKDHHHRDHVIQHRKEKNQRDNPFFCNSEICF